MRQLRHADYLAWKENMDQLWDKEDESRPLDALPKQERTSILKGRYNIKMAEWNRLIERADASFSTWAQRERQQFHP